MRNVRIWGFAAAILLLVIASGPGLFRSFAPAEIDSAQAARRAGVGAIVAIGLVAVAVVWWRRTQRSNPPAGHTFGVAGAVAGLALLATLFAALGASTATSPPPADRPGGFEAPPPLPPSTAVAITIPAPTPLDNGQPADLDWLITLLQLLVLATVIAGVVKAIVVLRRHRATLTTLAPHDDTFVQPVPPAAADIDNEAAADSFASSARALLDDGDPRRAIIAAYAALLDGLEAAGAGRRPHEAPEEHLQRSLTQLRIPAEALAGVTRLFLVAKFSTHPLGESDRDHARAMLDIAERHLRSLAPAS